MPQALEGRKKTSPKAPNLLNSIHSRLIKVIKANWCGTQKSVVQCLKINLDKRFLWSHYDFSDDLEKRKKQHAECYVTSTFISRKNCIYLSSVDLKGKTRREKQSRESIMASYMCFIVQNNHFSFFPAACNLGIFSVEDEEGIYRNEVSYEFRR